ncbi:MAG: xanthine dehydrogenase family protein molybdopterin-binding subunit [Deltaproteobacteria bacterium]|nr:xanthine dehydrogenase family protein molybdopterin-binding subunit [Deltaproteobacteria bacterium]
MAAHTTERAPSTSFLRSGRRGFVAGAGGFVLGVVLRARTRADAPGPLSDVAGGDATPDLWIALEDDGTARITCHRSEMGQQTWTAMCQLVAEELEIPWDRVVVEQAVGDAKYGDQNTDGSRSVRQNFTRLRIAGAAMRQMLEQAAATEWGVSPRQCKGIQGEVVHTGSERKLPYGQLAAAAARLTPPTERRIQLKDPSEWRYVSKPTPSLTIPSIVRGEGTFGIDVRLPDMLHAVIARPPQVLGSVRSYDDTATRAVAGVVQTVELPTLEAPVGFKPLGGVAVIARDTWSAIRGRAELQVEWDPGPNGSYDSQTYEAELLRKVREPGRARRARGDTMAALESAHQRVSAEYYVPHLAHSTMEPPAATARWDGDRVECWACTQNPQAARRTVAEVCGVPEAQVTVHVTWLGGGFGRKSKQDFVAEAALLAREVGKPVKVTWTREDELRHGYYHTVSAQRLEGALDDAGKCTAFLHRTVFPPIASTFQAGASEPGWGDLRLGASDTPFAVPNLLLETGEAEAHVRIGWLRSVANIYHAFAVQSFVAELAHAAGRDPKDMLLELIGPPRRVDPRREGAEYDNYGSSMETHPVDTGRLRTVTEMVAELADWGRPLPEGHGLGIAAHRSFTSYVATVVEVAMVDERLTIPAVWSVMDAGTVVNTDHALSQLEGGTLFGLSNALYGEITARDGAVVQDNFPRWRVMRMGESPPRMEVRLVLSGAPPGGVGEPPTPPAAPALANAIFAATGTRVRRLPVFGADRRDRLGGDR